MEEKNIIIINTDGTHEIVPAVPEAMLQQLQGIVDGFIEIVRMQRVRQPVDAAVGDAARFLCCVVNDCGLLQNLRWNATATWLMGYPEMLAGRAAILMEGLNENGEPDLLPLNKKQAVQISQCLIGLGSRRM